MPRMSVSTLSSRSASRFVVGRQASTEFGTDVVGTAAVDVAESKSD